MNLPLTGTLINGSQSLFGLKTQLQFGNLSVTGILSRQQGKSESIKIDNGFQGREFEILGSNYDRNRHFFFTSVHIFSYDLKIIVFSDLVRRENR